MKYVVILSVIKCTSASLSLFALPPHCPSACASPPQPEQVNALLSFVVPMAAISALNGMIASQLLHMFRQAERDTRVCIVGGSPTMLSVSMEPSRIQSLRHGVMVLRKYTACHRHRHTDVKRFLCSRASRFFRDPLKLRRSCEIRFFFLWGENNLTFSALLYAANEIKFHVSSKA